MDLTYGFFSFCHGESGLSGSQKIQKLIIQCGPSMMSWVNPYSFIESLHLNYKDVIDSPHCMYGNMNNNMKDNIEPKQMQKNSSTECRRSLTH